MVRNCELIVVDLFNNIEPFSPVTTILHSPKATFWKMENQGYIHSACLLLRLTGA